MNTDGIYNQTDKMFNGLNHYRFNNIPCRLKNNNNYYYFYSISFIQSFRIKKSNKK